MAVELPSRCSARFRVERVLAAGAFGAVIEATQIALDRRVALKVLHSAKLAEVEAMTRFLDEARITASLSSPHIVRVVDHDAEQGVPWIAYELLPGGTLSDAVAGGPMAWPDACNAGAQIAAALEEAHARGILHRDIKPRNVMDAGDGNWKVADFGLARWDSRTTVLTNTGAVMGTPHYMAPEMVRGEVAVPQTDLYALGVLLHELIAGEPPLAGPTVLAVLEAHLKAPPPMLSARVAGVPPELDALLQALLDKEIARRPQSARAVRLELEKLLAEAPPSFAAARNATSHLRAPALDATTPRAGAPADQRAADATSPRAPAASRGSGPASRGSGPASRGSGPASGGSGPASRPTASPHGAPPGRAPGIRTGAGLAALLAIALGGAFRARAPERTSSPVTSPTPAPAAASTSAGLTEAGVHERMQEAVKLLNQYLTRAQRDHDALSGRRSITNLAEVAPILERALITATALARDMRAARLHGPIWAETVHPVCDEMLIVSAWSPAGREVSGITRRIGGLVSEIGVEADAGVFQRFTAAALAARRTSLSEISMRKAADELRSALEILESGAPAAWRSSVVGVRVRMQVALDIVNLIQRSATTLVLGGDRKLDVAWRHAFEIGAQLPALPEGPVREGVARETLRVDWMVASSAVRVARMVDVAPAVRRLAADRLEDTVRRLKAYRFIPALMEERDRVLQVAGRK